MVPRDSPERDSIVAESIKWSTPEGHKHGHPRMHQMFAHYLWSAKRYITLACRSKLAMLYVSH